MNESGGTGAGPFGPPRGLPERPLLEAVIVFTAFYLASFLFSGSPGAAVSSPAYHLLALSANLPRAALVLYIMATGDGLALFNIARIRRADCARGLLCAIGAIGIVFLPTWAFSALGIENPLFLQARSWPRAGAGLVPLFLASSMATGYCEELFFRSYLMRRLAQAGLTPLWAAIVSSLLFGGGHGYQGVIGLVTGSLLGLFFAWRWGDSGNIHEIAIGHGLFDAAAFAIMLYS